VLPLVATNCETNVTLPVCLQHAELRSDVRDIKNALFGEHEDGLVATVQQAVGSWQTLRWIFGGLGTVLLAGGVFLFVSYVESPFKYAKTEDVNKMVTQQTLMMEKVGNIDEAVKDLTKELKRRP
jgi:hypothetical protein